MNKKTFIKPEAKALAMQTQDMICQSISAADPNTPSSEVPTSAEAKRGPRMGGPITSTTFAWN